MMTSAVFISTFSQSAPFLYTNQRYKLKQLQACKMHALCIMLNANTKYKFMISLFLIVRMFYSAGSFKVYIFFQKSPMINSTASKNLFLSIGNFLCVNVCCLSPSLDTSSIFLLLNITIIESLYCIR